MNTVLVSTREGVRTLTLNRPERRNALTAEMQEELIAQLEAAAADESVRVLVLTGAGEAFCAGLDLSALEAMAGKSTDEHEADARRNARMFRTLYDLPVPSIAAVNGHAIAGGAGLATICDFTYAVPEAKFSYTEVKIGFVPALVSAYLTLQIGDKRARDLLLTARLFAAEEAYRLGLVTEVVMHHDMSARVSTLATCLKANAPSSQRATKRLLSLQHKPWLDTAIENAFRANALQRGEPDFQEGVRSFLEKRKPAWHKAGGNPST